MELKVRLYDSPIKVWKDGERTIQYELPYREYRLEDGSLCAEGTEDWSRERAKNLMVVNAWAWDGERRNKGGYRWFERKRKIIIDSRLNREALKLMKMLYGTVQFRDRMAFTVTIYSCTKAERKERQYR